MSAASASTRRGSDAITLLALLLGAGGVSY